LIERAAARIDSAVEDELLERVRQLSPAAFERPVMKLLEAMGYGARGEGKHVGRPGDQGVDVEIAEDAPGLERIFVQAKRYGEQSTVGSPELQQFIGALVQRGMRKGVFVTSGRFTPEAERVAKQSQLNVVLVDGPRLVRLMREKGVGVRPQRTIVLHRLDGDFFTQLEEEA